MNINFLKNATVAVLRGGWSGERQVSLTSGQAVLAALQTLGVRTRDVVVERNPAAVLQGLQGADIAFNALHGIGGEDGVLQGLLTMAGIPFTHSGVLASAVAMDKNITRRLVASVGVPVAEGIVTTRAALKQALPLPLPLVVKPVADGSSLGIVILHTEQDWQQLSHSDDQETPVLVERYIAGMELTCPVLGDNALPVIEITPQTGFYDYASKYQEDVHAGFTIPARIPSAVAAQVQAFSVLVHHTLGCRGVSRSDFRYDSAKNQLIFLEINTQPGLTPLSLVPASAQAAGLSFSDVILNILHSAWPKK